MGRPLSNFCLIVVSLLLTSALGFAQTNTATLSGSVTDPSHAAIPGARLTLTSEETGRSTVTASNSVGQFTFNFVPIGTYDLRAEAKGFQSLVHKQISLSAAQTVNLNLTMQVGSVKQAITVSGQAPLVNATTSQQHNLYSSRKVNNLPLARLDWTNLLELGTGITTKSSTGLAMNGLAPAAFNFTVDGTNASADPELPSFGFYQGFNIINAINNDAIAEVSVVKGIAPASVSGTMSGNVNVITKSGTNQFHGDLFEFNDVSAFDARNQFLTSKPRSTFNQYGGSVGGPILRNKIFFFGSYEGARLRAFRAVSADVPTPYFESISPSVYQPIFSLYPKVAQPTSDPTALTVRVHQPGSTAQTDYNGSGQVDAYITQNDRLTLRYTRQRPNAFSPRIPSINPRATSGHNDKYNAEYIHTGGIWTNSFRFGFNRLYLNRLDEGFGVDLEAVSFGGFGSGGAESFFKIGSTYTWEDNVAINHGRHSIQFGGIIQRQNAGRKDFNTAELDYSTLSDFLSNTPDRVVITFDTPSFQFHEYQLGGFVQDNYRATSHLTLNLGLRYDYFTVPKERDGNSFNRGLDPARPYLGYGFGPYRPASSMYNGDFNNVSPRVGFAYAFGQSRNTVIRGGFGMFVNPHPIFGGPIEEKQPAVNVPFRVYLSRAQAAAGGIHYPLPRSQFIPTLDLLQSKGVLSTNVTNTSINPNFPNPYSMQWTLGVERNLGWGTVLDVAYVGNRGLKMNVVEMQNLPDRLTGITPAPTFGSFRLYTPLDASTYHSLQVSLRKRFSKGIAFGANYTLANNTSFETGNLLLETPPQDNNNLRADLGPTPYDIRNRFTANFLYTLPFEKLTNSSSGPAKLLLAGWHISGIFSADDGLPANITNGNSSYPSDRPDKASGVSQVFNNYTSTLQYLNILAYTPVPIVPASGAQLRPGNLGRDSVFGPGEWNLDGSLGKTFPLAEHVGLQLRGDFFNAFNHTNLSGLVTNISKGSFGQLTSATARTIQISARLTF